MTSAALPRWSVQENWQNEDSFWVSRYIFKGQSVHGSVKAQRQSSGEVKMTGEDGIIVSPLRRNAFQVKTESELPCVVHAADQEYKMPASVNCIDVSPEESLIAAAMDDGSVSVTDVTTRQMRLTLKAHLLDASVVRFFPSGQVLISGGTDMQLKIWSAIDGSCPVTLKGHTRPITGVGIIDRGRNVVSSSRDGSIKLWEVASASAIAGFKLDEVSSVNKVAIAESSVANSGDVKTDAREVGTMGKVVVGVTEAGSILGWDVGSRTSVFHVRTSSPLNAVAMNTTNGIFTGSHDGILSYYDARKMNSPISQVQRNDAPIWSIEADNNLLLVGSGDGSMFRCTLEPTVQLMEEYITDNEPVYSVISAKQCVYAASRRGKVFKYQ